ncbi:MAG: serpin family protein [Myxococcota bacterium]
MSLPSLFCALFACPAAAPPEAPPQEAPAPAPAPDVASSGAFAQASNAFGADLFAKLQAERTPGQNLVISPASVSLALAMTATGAGGETAAQMAQVLHVDAAGDLDAFTADASAQLALWRSASDGYELAVANRLFGEQSVTFAPAFLQATGDRFGAPLEALDFRHDADGGRQHINGWVSDQTDGRIPSLLPSGSLDADTSLVLANAVFFDGDWASAFDPAATAEAPFHAAAGDVAAQMMHQTAQLRTAEVDGVRVVQLPYAGGHLSMLVALPAEGATLTPSAAALQGWADALAPAQVALAMPKLDLHPDVLSLADTLGALGMPLALTDGADFSGMTAEERLHISGVFHQAQVTVDEVGTQAAAATAVVMTRETAVLAPPPVAVTLDRPFLFLIRDDRTGTVLFLGQVATPA